MSTTVMTGDTVRVKGTFTDYAVTGSLGSVIDPDANAATYTIYNSDFQSLSTGSASRISQGIYYYDWTVPSIEGTYYFEFKGLFSTKPQLNRQTYKVKFKPVT